jgi:hypothetical protein
MSAQHATRNKGASSPQRTGSKRHGQAGGMAAQEVQGMHIKVCKVKDPRPRGQAPRRRRQHLRGQNAAVAAGCAGPRIASGTNRGWQRTAVKGGWGGRRALLHHKGQMALEHGHGAGLEGRVQHNLQPQQAI